MMWLSFTFLAALFTGPPAPAARAELPKELLQIRLEAAQEAYKGILKRLEVDPSAKLSIDDLALWSRRILESQRALCKTHKEEIAAAQEHLERMVDLVQRTGQMVKNRTLAPHEAAFARYHRAEAEILLWGYSRK
jgi:hypothetical protein